MKLKILTFHASGLAWLWIAITCALFDHHMLAAAALYITIQRAGEKPGGNLK